MCIRPHIADDIGVSFGICVCVGMIFMYRCVCVCIKRGHDFPYRRRNAHKTQFFVACFVQHTRVTCFQFRNNQYQHIKSAQSGGAQTTSRLSVCAVGTHASYVYRAINNRVTDTTHNDPNNIIFDDDVFRQSGRIINYMYITFGELLVGRLEC